MAKRKINVIDSEKEQNLTESLFKNIKRLKNQKLYPNVPEEVMSEERDQTIREIEEGVYDEQIAAQYRDNGTVIADDPGSLVDELEQKITEQLDKGYADAYTKMKKSIDSKKLEDFRAKLAPYVKNLANRIDEVRYNGPQDNGSKVTIREDGPYGKVELEDKILECLDKIRTDKIKSFKNTSPEDINKNKKDYLNMPKDFADRWKNKNEVVNPEKEETTEYEMVNHPTHYNNYDKEVIDMIEAIWGTYLASVWCEITAFKYRMRMGTKPGNDMDQDLNKEKWYLDKYAELKEKINNGQGI